MSNKENLSSGSTSKGSYSAFKNKKKNSVTGSNVISSVLNMKGQTGAKLQ
jgi:hypothetical protein